MRDYARQAVAVLHGRARNDLEADRLLQLAMAHLLWIISEAASHVTQAGRTGHPAIPWREAIAFRDRVQGYDFRIDNDSIWRIVHDDLPALITNLERTTGASS
jgi:uncharacterized protein with HEPN domain